MLILIPAVKDIAGFGWVRFVNFCFKVVSLNSVSIFVIVNKCNYIIFFIKIRTIERKSKNTFQVLIYMQYVPAFNPLGFIIFKQGYQYIVIA